MSTQQKLNRNHCRHSFLVAGCAGLNAVASEVWSRVQFRREDELVAAAAEKGHDFCGADHLCFSKVVQREQQQDYHLDHLESSSSAASGSGTGTSASTFLQIDEELTVPQAQATCGASDVCCMSVSPCQCQTGLVRVPLSLSHQS